MRELRHAEAGRSQVGRPARRDNSRISAFVIPASASGAATWWLLAAFAGLAGVGILDVIPAAPGILMVMPLEPAHAHFGIVQGVSRVIHEAIVEFACQQPQGEEGEQDEQVAQEQPGPPRRATARPQAPGEEHDQPTAEESQQQVEAEHQVIVHASVVPPPGVGRWHSNISPEPAAPDNAIPPNGVKGSWSSGVLEHRHSMTPSLHHSALDAARLCRAEPPTRPLLAKPESSGCAKKGCAQGWNYGFIPVVLTGGEVIFLPEAIGLWHLGAGQYCESQANAGHLLGPSAGCQIGRAHV